MTDARKLQLLQEQVETLLRTLRAREADAQARYDAVDATFSDRKIQLHGEILGLAFAVGAAGTAEKIARDLR